MQISHNRTLEKRHMLSVSLPALVESPSFCTSHRAPRKGGSSGERSTKPVPICTRGQQQKKISKPNWQLKSSCLKTVRKLQGFMFWHLIRVEWCNRPKKDSQSEQKKKRSPSTGLSSPAGVISLVCWMVGEGRSPVQDGSLEIMITLLLPWRITSHTRGARRGRRCIPPPMKYPPVTGWRSSPKIQTPTLQKRTHNRIVTCF